MQSIYHTIIPKFDTFSIQTDRKQHENSPIGTRPASCGHGACLPRAHWKKGREETLRFFTARESLIRADSQACAHTRRASWARREQAGRPRWGQSAHWRASMPTRSPDPRPPQIAQHLRSPPAQPFFAATMARIALQANSAVPSPPTLSMFAVISPPPAYMSPRQHRISSEQ